MKIRQYLAILLIAFVQAALASAPLNIELTRGINAAIPIAIMPFAIDQSTIDISQIIQADLNHSGRFKIFDNASQRKAAHTPTDIDFTFWQNNNIDHVIVGKMTHLPNQQLRVDYALVDTFTPDHAYKQTRAKVLNQSQILLQGSFTIKANAIRQLAHQISDTIFQALIGERGIFSTKIAYIQVQRQQGRVVRYLLNVADSDGYNPQTLLSSSEPIMSPAWSPDGTRLAYVSFEHKRAQIFISELASGKRRLLTRFPGINGAPAWAPDGKSLAIVLSKDGHPNIYIKNLQTNRLQQLTKDNAISTEPSFSPDGSKVIFTSDRGGAPQIYQYDLSSKQVTRVTFDGNYNARASFAPDGMHLVMLHREQGTRNFVIATMDLQTGDMALLTEQGMSESPSFAPNGRMILFSTQYGQKQLLSVVSIDQNVSLRLPAPDASVREPAWSPYLS